MNPSRFEAFFNTNYAASDVEAEEIKRIIRGSEQELAVLDEEITKLESRRNKISIFVNGHRSLCSPVRRLPPELLSQIFIHCIPSQHLPTRSNLEAPLLFLQVCRKWRQVTLDTPALWCGLHVHLPDCSLDSALMQRRVRGINEWLEKSSTLPISLSLSLVLTGTSLHFENINTFLGNLTQKYSRRWKRLDLISADNISVIKTLQSTNFPTLEQFSLTYPTQYEVPATVPEFFKTISSLRGIRLENYTSRISTSALIAACSFQLENLTELVLHPLSEDNLTASDGLDLLKKAINLRYCSLHMYLRVPHRADQTQFTGTAQRLPHPFLHTLNLSFSGDSIYGSGNHLLPWFEQLDAPSLENLSVQAPYFMITEDCIPFLDMLTPRVKSILFDFGMTAEAWIQCLLRMPRLVSLSGKCGESKRSSVLRWWSNHLDSNKWGKVLQLLAPSEDGIDVLCPELEIINFSLVEYFGVKELIGLVGARQRMAMDIQDDVIDNAHCVPRSKKLSSVTAFLERHSKLTESDYAEIARLRRCGTDIYLKFPSDPFDSPWIGLSGISLLDGRELKWSWSDEHTETGRWKTVYSTSGPKGMNGVH
ncbi:hypothetical protein VKT23_013526 [Stygiomarasmius scandens]|uniref:F-box domain-containing protein n=1 Tax=Marasmiellus scandens TaxID=2682957 RepID=A0ABR1J3Y3_9AGAR